MDRINRLIDWEKPYFIGRKAAIAERDGNGPQQVQVTLEVEAENADASGYEPESRSNGKRVGFVTSGGYGHTTGNACHGWSIRIWQNRVHR